MTVKLVSITQPLVHGVETAEEFLAYVARVSNPTNQNNSETAPRLIKYLIKNRHWSPFEMVHMTLEVKTTRDIARQILRHRSFSFQEFSQRYAEVTEFAEPREARLQDKKNRQNSIELTDENDQKFIDPNTFEPFTLSDMWKEQQEQLILHAEAVYRFAIEKGIAKEVARSVLPEGLTTSTMYMSGSLRSWLHYVDLRCSNGTQKEHRGVALAVRDIIGREFPAVGAAMESIRVESGGAGDTPYEIVPPLPK